MPNSSYYPDDIVTIAEARERLAETSPTRDAFHKAITRGKLKKLPGQAGNHDVHLRWGDILDYVAAGGFKNCSPRSANASDTVTSFEHDEEASSMVTALSCIAATGADTFIGQEPAEVISVEVLPKETDAECPTDLEEVEKLLVELPFFEEQDYITHIRIHSSRAVVQANQAVAVGSHALINAWACGTILNTAKKKCKHGKFIPWLMEHLHSEGISIRTCQRHMKLAKTRLGDLVERQPGLKDAYVACGILPPPKIPISDPNPSNREGTAQGKEHPTLAKPLMSCAANLQKRLRDFAASGESLTTGDIDKLGEVMNELSCFYGQLQEQTNGMNQTAAA